MRPASWPNRRRPDPRHRQPAGGGSGCGLCRRAQGIRLSFVIEIDCGEHRSGAARGRCIHCRARTRDPCLAASAAARDHDARRATPTPRMPRPVVERHRTFPSATRQWQRRPPSARAGFLANRQHRVHADGAVRANDLRGHHRGPLRHLHVLGPVAGIAARVPDRRHCCHPCWRSVIGHSKAAGALILDAGALALSKDLGAQRLMPEAAYGLRVRSRNGRAAARPSRWRPSIRSTAPYPSTTPPGSSACRSAAWCACMPNHACITCAAYDAYAVVRGGEVVATWPRVNGW